ncbi:MAG: DUF4935 domain-containing protein [Moritella sp.]|uniref:PIN domain-containing protein n=1 Tax=Moritella sp. TaxID=78556 RepID=UPI001E0ACE9F|nr:PIN domain-containing protein [Moritella sp.]NQZ51858.1 DUF4935 domain-containing protein [Moritella sp.]
MKANLQDLCDLIINDPKPVMFIDTCVFLDIVRVCARDNSNVNTITSAHKLIDMNSVWIVISEIVESEWKENIDVVFPETERHLKHLDKNMALFKSSLEKFPSLGGFEYTKKPTEYGVHHELKKLSEALYRKALIIEADTNCFGKAMIRVIQNVAPSAKGKDESKDCSIYEHYLALANLLKQQSFDKQILFASSNKADFGDPSAPRPPIDEELSGLGIQFVNNLPWATSLLG